MRIEIHDVAGRLVRSFEPERCPPARIGFAWDGRGEGGARLAPGVFFVTIETETERSHAKVLRLDR